MSQWNARSPARLTVTVRVSPPLTGPESKEPSSAVTVWSVGSWLTTCTVAPTGAVTVENSKLSIVTTGEPLAGARSAGAAFALVPDVPQAASTTRAAIATPGTSRWVHLPRTAIEGVSGAAGDPDEEFQRKLSIISPGALAAGCASRDRGAGEGVEALVEGGVRQCRRSAHAGDALHGRQRRRRG